MRYVLSIRGVVQLVERFIVAGSSPATSIEKTANSAVFFIFFEIFIAACLK